MLVSSVWVNAACGDDGAARIDAASTSDEPPTSTDAPPADLPNFVCDPGTRRCRDASALERCAPTGKAWIAEPCPSKAMCVPCEDDQCVEDRCLGPCESADELPSSAGCSFIANRQLHEFAQIPDGLVVANPNTTQVATVRHLVTAEGTNDEELVDEILLAPLEAHIFELSTDFVQGNGSMFRSGGTHRVETDVPVVAYHHAPLQLARSNDSSMLLPEGALGTTYVVPSYAPMADHPVGGGEPSYFEIVALEDFTRLEWFPPVATAGNGLPVPFVPPGGSGSLRLNRFDTVRIAASAEGQADANLRDVSGTIIEADRRIWVTAGVRCSRVPLRDPEAFPGGHCDPLQEMLIPLQYWGTQYVGVASPPRETERQWWRLYAGTPGVTIDTDPPQPGMPVVLQERGDYVELSVAAGTHVIFTGDGAFLPVGYLQSSRELFDQDGAGPGVAEPEAESTRIGAPSMVQMIPVEQFLSRYVFATALNFPINYVQVIRPAGGPDVVLDGGEVVDGFVPVGDYEVADVPLAEASDPTEATHELRSDGAFGIVQIGYSTDAVDPDCFIEPEFEGLNCLSSYAYPGGMKSEPIYIP
jgi:hypothetical protein